MKRRNKPFRALTVLALIAAISALDITTYAAEDSVCVIAEDLSVSSRFYELLFERDKENEKATPDVKYLVPGGDVFGVKIECEHVSVADNREALSADPSFPLQNGDEISKINGVDVKSAADVKKMLANAENSISVTVKRDKKTYTFEIPLMGEKGNYHIGIALRDSAAGIGTVTFIDPETNRFGGLGHAISDPNTGDPIEMTQGEVTNVLLGGVKKGEAGKPGELHGVLKNETVGTISKNDERGVFGTIEKTVPEKDALPVGNKEELKAGEATILSTVKNGERSSYSVMISDIHKDEKGSKCFTVTVTDEALLSMTGGIVRGMSGSPILQDGKLFGAVTHVLISNPKVGYGIFIENMLDAMNENDSAFEYAA